MEIEILEDYEKNVILVKKDGIVTEYLLDGPCLPTIFGYPYPDFLWAPEASEGESYSIIASNGVSLEAEYERITKREMSLPRGARASASFSVTEVHEKGTATGGDKTFPFERKTVDYHPGGDILEGIKKREYEPSRFTWIETRIGGHEESVFKAQAYRNGEYAKSVSITGEGQTLETMRILETLYPSRTLLRGFDNRDYDIDLKIIERVVKREGLDDQEFDKRILQMKGLVLLRELEAREIISGGVIEKHVRVVE